MATFYESFQKRRLFPTMALKEDLPISQYSKPEKETHLAGLRKRMQPISSASVEWAFQKPNKAMASGNGGGGWSSTTTTTTTTTLRKWWDWSWSWVLSRKLAFAQDLEMNEEESAVLGLQSRGSLRHLFYKVRSEITKVFGCKTLPITQKFSYAKISTKGR